MFYIVSRLSPNCLMLTDRVSKERRLTDSVASVCLSARSFPLQLMNFLTLDLCFTCVFLRVSSCMFYVFYRSFMGQVA